MTVYSTSLLQANHKTALAAGAIAVLSITGLVLSILGLQKTLSCPQNMPIPVLAISSAVLVADMAWVGAIHVNRKRIQGARETVYEEAKKQNNAANETAKELRKIESEVTLGVAKIANLAPQEALAKLREYQTMVTGVIKAKPQGVIKNELSRIEELKKMYKKDTGMMHELNSWYTAVEWCNILESSLKILSENLSNKVNSLGHLDDV